eukprot:Sspe_Gene.4987::Locus_1635_Transcript_1_4_Confidence_0.333_Length_1285::g.4987::m.4987
MAQTDEATVIYEKTNEDIDTAEKWLMSFSKSAPGSIWNAGARQKYIADVARNASQLRAQATNVMNTLEGGARVQAMESIAQQASNFRNAALTTTRENITGVARGISKLLKEEGLSMVQLLNKYTDKLRPGVAFAALNDADKAAVYSSIIEASGRTNTTMNNLSKLFGAGSVLLIVVGLIFSAIAIAQSKNPGVEAAQIVTEFVVGVVVSEVASAALVGPITTAMVGLGASSAVAAGIATGGVVAIAVLIGIGLHFLFNALFDLFRPEGWAAIDWSKESWGDESWGTISWKDEPWSSQDWSKIDWSEGEPSESRPSRTDGGGRDGDRSGDRSGGRSGGR